MLTFPHVTRRPRPSHALPRSFMRSMPIDSFTGPTWVLTSRCTVSRSEILESLDEHFYEIEQFDYHWSLNGFGLSGEILKQVYQDNAAKLVAARTAQAGLPLF